MKKKISIYKINTDYACVISNGEIVPLLSFVSDETLQFLLEEKKSIFYDEYDRLRLVPNIDEVNNQIREELENNNIPNELLFIYDREDEVNDEYIYLREVFSDISIKFDKGLVSIFRINKLTANLKLLDYDLDQIDNIKQLMSSAKRQMSNQKIIDFPIKRVKER